MQLKFKGVEYNTVPQGVISAVKFERQFGMPFAEAFAAEVTPKMDWMCFLAYTELVAAGAPVGAYNDEFLAGLEFIPDAPDAPAAVPLDPAAPTT